jgi:hypothetical protein
MPETSLANLNQNGEMPGTPAGKLLVLHDEYMLSDYGIQQAPDTEIFINNIAKLLTNSKGGRCLDYSTYYTVNPTAQGNVMGRILSSPPYSFTRDRSAPLDMDTLRSYKIIFVGGEQVDNQLLIDYIMLGGSVCLIAGTGHGGSESESAQWNQLLSAFGLRLETSYNDITGVLPVTSPDHPLFAGVAALFQYWGQTVHLLPDSKASLIMTSGSKGLIGYAEVPVASAEVAASPAAASEATPVAPSPASGPTATPGTPSPDATSQAAPGAPSPAAAPSASPAAPTGTQDPGLLMPDALKQGSIIKLKSWKGDFLHRPDSPQGVTTWHSGVGNEWTVEVSSANKIRLQSWKGDYLHRPDSAQGVTTRNSRTDQEWTVEVIAANTIRLRSWKNDCLHRPDSPQDVTSSGTGIGNEWTVEAVSPAAKRIP